MITLVCPACRDARHGPLCARELDENEYCPNCHTQHSFRVSNAKLSNDVWVSNHWQQPDQLQWLRVLLAGLDDLPAGPVLIIGAAACGEVSAVPAARHVVCLDINREPLSHAKSLAGTDEDRLAHVELICGNALNPPFGPKSFALIICLNVLDSIADPEVLLGQCEALLIPTGALVLSCPYQFRDDVTPKSRWLTTVLRDPADLEAAVERLVTGAWDEHYMASMRLQWSDRRVPWRVVVNERMTVEYSSHAMLLRRLPNT